MNNPNGGGVLPNLPSTSSTPSLPNVGEVLDPEVEELWSSRALLLVLLLLILSFWVSYYLKVHRIRSIHETIVAMFSGMLVGALVRLSPGHVVQDMIAFKSTILLNVLLPPIILNSGYSLKQESFFKSFAVILTFAFAGTFISAVALGVIVYLYSLLGLEGLSLTIIECLLFGSTLSATDPVTILAIFNALHVDPKLYSVIFGESLLNDAVAIVMFETLSQFHGEKIHVLSFFHGVGIFLLTFFISMALGVLFGLSCSLMLKHSELGRYTEIEACLVFLIAYTSYFFSNALTMSGIVSLLFCGITLKHYAFHNMSLRTQRSSRYMFGSLASLSENFIFIYLGLSLFTQTELVYKPLFIVITFIAMCIARHAAIFPISKVVNLFFRARGAREDEIPKNYQMVLYWAGLRGAVGVALAEGMRGQHAIALRTTVLVSVVLSVVVFGSTIQRVVETVGIRTGVTEEQDEETDDEYEFLAEHDGESRHRKKNSLAHGTPGTSHHFETMAGRSFGGGGLPFNGEIDQLDTSASSLARSSSSYRGGRSGARFAGVRSPNSVSSASDESDPDLLPSPTEEVTRPGGLGAAWSTLDETYLLPVFSDPTAARNKEARRKRMSRSPLEEEEARSPYGVGGEGKSKSLADVVGALVKPALGSGGSSEAPSRVPMTPHLYANPSSPYPSTDLTAATSARDRGHTPSGSYSNSSGPAAAVKPFGGRRSSGRGESPGGGEGGRRS